jgi:transposase-like protein
MERARHSYSEDVKRQLVEEIESGRMSIREAASEARAGVTQVQKWLEEYGRFKPKRDIVEVVMKREKDKITELEKALAEAHLKIRVYDELINQANKKYKTDIKKNFGTERSESSVEEDGEKKSAKSARYLNAPGTRTTSAGSGVEQSQGRRR